MKKALKFIIFAILAFIMAMPLAQANHSNRYENFPAGNSQFQPRDPEYYNGNLRHTLKTRSGIEHSSSSNLHYDEYKRDYYRCDWVYNKNLGSWACDKDYGKVKAQPVQVCPVGYAFSATYQTCLSGNQPAPTVVVQPVRFVEVEPTITYYTYAAPAPKPTALPSSGPATNWVLFMLAIGGLTSFSLSRTQNKSK